MKQLCILILVSLLTACGPKSKSTNEVTNQNEETFLPKLTKDQKAEGWKLLFDGKSLDGWRFYKGQENNSWEVTEGTLHCKNFDEGKKRADLITVNQYDNFELTFEWKISYQGNSGVMFRVSEDYDQPYFTGPEYQTLDDDNYPGEVDSVNFSGGTFGMYAPENKKLNPVGQWNSSKLVVNGSNIEHWLNGIKVVNYEIGSEDWNKRKQASKWKDVETYASLSKGYIDLQDHTQEVWFRNIMIKEL